MKKQNVPAARCDDWDVCHGVWAPPDSNRRPTGYASHYDFRRPFRVCGLDCPFTQVKDRGCLPSSLYTFPLVAGLARDYRTITST